MTTKRDDTPDRAPEQWTAEFDGDHPFLTSKEVEARRAEDPLPALDDDYQPREPNFAQQEAAKLAKADAAAARRAPRPVAIPTVKVAWGREFVKKGRAIPWIWRGWLPASMLTLIFGQKGTGKSTLLMTLIAHLTTGRWPWGNAVGEPCRVIYWSGEDHPAVLVGRALAAGVDVSRFGLIDVTEAGTVSRPFLPSADMRLLLDQLKEDPVDVIVIDPVISVLQGKNNSAEDVRRSVEPIAAAATALGIAIIGIGHFAKGERRPGHHRPLSGQRRVGASCAHVLGRHPHAGGFALGQGERPTWPIFAAWSPSPSRKLRSSSRTARRTCTPLPDLARSSSTKRSTKPRSASWALMRRSRRSRA